MVYGVWSVTHPPVCHGTGPRPSYVSLGVPLDEPEFIQSTFGEIDSQLEHIKDSGFRDMGILLARADRGLALIILPDIQSKACHKV